MKPVATIASEPSDERGTKALDYFREKYPDEEWSLIPEVGRRIPCVKTYSTGVEGFDGPRLKERDAELSIFIKGTSASSV